MENLSMVLFFSVLIAYAAFDRWVSYKEKRDKDEKKDSGGGGVSGW